MVPSYLRTVSRQQQCSSSGGDELVCFFFNFTYDTYTASRYITVVYYRVGNYKLRRAERWEYIPKVSAERRDLHKYSGVRGIQV